MTGIESLRSGLFGWTEASLVGSARATRDVANERYDAAALGATNTLDERDRIDLTDMVDVMVLVDCMDEIEEKQESTREGE